MVWLRLPQLVLAAAQGRPGPPRESGRRRPRKAARARWAGRALEAGRRVGLREVRAGVQGTEGARTTPGLGSSHPGSDGVWHRARARWGDGQGAAAVAEGRIGAEALNSRCQSFCGGPRGLRRAAEAARCRQPFPLGVPAAPCGSRVRVQAPGRLVHPPRGSDQLTPGPAAPGPRTPAPAGRPCGPLCARAAAKPAQPWAPPSLSPTGPERHLCPFPVPLLDALRLGTRTAAPTWPPASERPSEQAVTAPQCPAPAPPAPCSSVSPVRGRPGVEGPGRRLAAGRPFPPAEGRRAPGCPGPALRAPWLRAQGASRGHGRAAPGAPCDRSHLHPRHRASHQWGAVGSESRPPGTDG